MRLSRRAFLASGLSACDRSSRGPSPPDAIELWFGGDFHVGAEPRSLEGLAPALEGSLGVVNLEGPVGSPPHASKDDGQVRLSQSMAALRAAVPKVAVWTMANNHRLDRGPPGIVETRRAAAALGVRHVDTATTWRMGGRALELVTWSAPDPMPEVPRATERVLVASIHVTTRSSIPTAALREAVDGAIAAGARVVVAHGSHRVGPVERRGQVVVAWGLGNLAFSCDCTRERDAVLLRVRLGIAGTEAQVIPIEAGLAGAEPRLARDPAFAYEVLAALGSSPLSPNGPTAAF